MKHNGDRFAEGMVQREMHTSFALCCKFRKTFLLRGSSSLMIIRNIYKFSMLCSSHIRNAKLSITIAAGGSVAVVLQNSLFPRGTMSHKLSPFDP